MTHTSYDARRAQWQQLAGQLLPELRGRISLRNVAAVSRLLPHAQQTLAALLDAGLLQNRQVIRHLRQNPGASLDELAEIASRPRKGRQQDGRGKQARTGGGHLPATSIQGAASTDTEPDPRDVGELTGLFLRISPMASPISAEYWAREQAALLSIVRALREFLAADPPPAETNFAVFCALVLSLHEQVDRMIAARPAYRVTLEHLRLDWPGLRAGTKI